MTTRVAEDSLYAAGRRGRALTARMLALVWATMLVACGQSLSSIVAECPSPTGEMNAFAVIRGGGGAAGWVEMSVAVASRAVPRSTIEDERYFGNVARFGGGADVRLTWRGDMWLHVDYADASPVFDASPSGDASPDCGMSRL